mmetsp:Transcript_2521/g.8622  ORF Transcript_2521/g.8622 Transcript_2521/m.8622 type:complete len:515 (-) Transcript_2521:141-1685(-)
MATARAGRDPIDDDTSPRGPAVTTRGVMDVRKFWATFVDDGVETWYTQMQLKSWARVQVLASVCLGIAYLLSVVGGPLSGVFQEGKSLHAASTAGVVCNITAALGFFAVAGWTFAHAWHGAASRPGRDGDDGLALPGGFLGDSTTPGGITGPSPFLSGGSSLARSMGTMATSTAASPGLETPSTRAGASSARARGIEMINPNPQVSLANLNRRSAFICLLFLLSGASAMATMGFQCREVDDTGSSDADSPSTDSIWFQDEACGTYHTGAPMPFVDMLTFTTMPYLVAVVFRPVPWHMYLSTVVTSLMSRHVSFAQMVMVPDASFRMTSYIGIEVHFVVLMASVWGVSRFGRLDVAQAVHAEKRSQRYRAARRVARSLASRGGAPQPTPAAEKAELGSVADSLNARVEELLRVVSEGDAVAAERIKANLWGMRDELVRMQSVLWNASATRSSRSMRLFSGETEPEVAEGGDSERHGDRDPAVDRAAPAPRWTEKSTTLTARCESAACGATARRQS